MVYVFDEKIVVFHLAKILIRKQFTTNNYGFHNRNCCLSSCKDTNSKAIHNYSARSLKPNQVVFHLAKILIRKQFTTSIL